VFLWDWNLWGLEEEDLEEYYNEDFDEDLVEEYEEDEEKDKNVTPFFNNKNNPVP